MKEKSRRKLEAIRSTSKICKDNVSIAISSPIHLQVTLSLKTQVSKPLPAQHSLFKEIIIEVHEKIEI